ncbi:hypothetical protein HDU77_007016 [Chytriomyces hyalinus]|nr:hypothetical protein HDU77_007016 [Chytriomyces hyalinus]
MLCKALAFSSIESLSLTDNLLTDLGMRALAAHLDTSPVVHLDLSSNMKRHWDELMTVFQSLASTSDHGIYYNAEGNTTLTSYADAA